MGKVIPFQRPTKQSDNTNPPEPQKVYVRFGVPGLIEWLESIPPHLRKGGKLKITFPEKSPLPK